MDIYEYFKAQGVKIESPPELFTGDYGCYQSVYTKSFVTRNEALSGASHPVNKRFLYRTDETAFANPLNAQISCQVSYGYGISETVAEAEVELSVCLQPRTAYSKEWCGRLTKTVKQWRGAHQPPARGRYFHVEVTVFSTELQEEGLPVVSFSGLRLTDMK